MKFFKKIWDKMPFSANRRNISRELKTLWKPTPLLNTSRQSTGPLYEQFLSSDQGDIHKWHHYFDIYEQHLRRFVGTPVRFLEIGVFKGGALRMWREYLGPDAIIVGIDIIESCAQFDGLHAAVRIGDQCDKDFLAKVCEEFGPFDVVIDDGGHLPSQQITSFCFLYPLLSERGVYICEDTHMNYWSKRQDLGRKRTFVNFAKTIADHLTDHTTDAAFGEIINTKTGGDSERPLTSAEASCKFPIWRRQHIAFISMIRL